MIGKRWGEEVKLYDEQDASSTNWWVNEGREGRRMTEMLTIVVSTICEWITTPPTYIFVQTASCNIWMMQIFRHIHIQQRERRWEWRGNVAGNRPIHYLCFTVIIIFVLLLPLLSGVREVWTKCYSLNAWSCQKCGSTGRKKNHNLNGCIEASITFLLQDVPPVDTYFPFTSFIQSVIHAHINPLNELVRSYGWWIRPVTDWQPS